MNDFKGDSKDGDKALVDHLDAYSAPRLVEYGDPDPCRITIFEDARAFQGRYVMRHAWTGRTSCDAATAYRQSVRERHEQEAQSLASLTGWSLSRFARGLGHDGPPQPASWWERFWKR